jgi:hypothetical protein
MDNRIAELMARRPRTRRLVPLTALVTILVSLVIAPVAANATVGGSFHCGTLVYGAIEDKYLQLGAENYLGCPTGAETNDRLGGRTEDFQYGVIYWNAAVGAHAVVGQILWKWSTFNREAGFLGYPLTDELTTIDGGGRYNNFQGGAIDWTPTAGPHLSRIEEDWRPISVGNVSGFEHLTLFRNGGYIFSGHLHDDALFTPYDVGLVETVNTLTGHAFVFTERGTVHGTKDPRSSTIDWNSSGQNAALMADWMAVDEGFNEDARATSSFNLSDLWNETKSVVGVVSTVTMVVGSL